MKGREEPPEDASYAGAGVDIDAAERLVSHFAGLAKMARRPEVLADVGPFSGLFRLGAGYRDPVLAASTDSVGTKVKLAALLGRYEGTGHDIVNHCVNDILTAGAVPLFFLDYIGNCGLSDDAKADLVRGVASACRDAGCALLGGETADMPGTYAEGDYDLVGCTVGVVERDAVIDGSRIREGDVLLGLPSDGLHTNGYSLVRKVFGVGVEGDPEEQRRRLNEYYPELGETLGDALLRPHRCYLNDLQPVLGRLKGVAHVTGGGIRGNVPRIFPPGLAARIGRRLWDKPPIFRLIRQRGQIAKEEMYRTFNMGLGIVFAVAREDADVVRSQVPDSFVAGDVAAGTGVVWA